MTSLSNVTIEIDSIVTFDNDVRMTSKSHEINLLSLVLLQRLSGKSVLIVQFRLTKECFARRVRKSYAINKSCLQHA